MSKDLEFALELAQSADEISLSRFRALDLKVETKPDRTPVTDADKAVEERLREMISDYSPTDAVIGEEFGSSAGLASGLSTPLMAPQTFSEACQFGRH
jgi:histidinol-phosphatase